MTQPDIYTVEARRRVAAMDQAPGMAEAILSGEFTPSIIDLLAATLRELNWQPLVDPDLLEARKIAANDFRRDDCFAIADLLERGGNDDHSSVRTSLAAIKRGRELEATERGA